MRKRRTPVAIEGIGTGTETIKESMLAPAAIPTCDREGRDTRAQTISLEAGIANNLGDGLNGLIGMDFLRSKNSILDCGRNQLIFPGPGEVKIILPPGSTITPLAESPSGHMCMVVDEFEDLAALEREETSAKPMTAVSHAAADAAALSTDH